ncbi:hypothetical protein [Pseudarthrobacter phenanthrenivorans]|uniref:Alternate-type signal peptide domain-containing protein n=1 Tax=Pseudarthrobacter phenanthrenivorans TaxID=361575 RepID=A0A0B4DWD0_PSEPS|nr:hypothetical protein [Pseudarthrobacter phenanthrenivorans]KIC68735.1 hypothetical protein RM50_04600 [Pseudarthrobacter phenanthrenivorans]
MSKHAFPAEPVAGSVVPAKQKGSKKKKLLLGLAALGVGAALITGGGALGVTNANWEKSITTPGEKIQGGKLGDALSGQPGYFDTSSDKAAPTPIDLATFRAVPGDQMSIAQAQAVTMIGNNLKADLIVELPVGGALTNALAAPGSGVTGHVYVGKGTYDPATFNPAQALASAPLDGTGPTAVVHFNQPALNGGEADLNDGTLTDGTPKLFGVVIIDYALSSTDNTVQGTEADLSAITYHMKQAR